MTNQIKFTQASKHHLPLICEWLSEPHIQEFWDNTQGHKDDIINFIEGRTTPSTYCGGKYVYWIASHNHAPFAMIMTLHVTEKEDVGELQSSQRSTTGNSYVMDYMIGNLQYLGKGFGAPTLKEFIIFFCTEYDTKADVFLIDPAADNPRAKHVYMKAGFTYVDDFIMAEGYSGSGKRHHLLVKKCPRNNKEWD